MEAYYSLAEVAARFKVSKMTVYRWIWSGCFPNAIKLKPEGRTSPYRIPAADITAFEDKRRRPVAA